MLSYFSFCSSDIIKWMRSCRWKNEELLRNLEQAKKDLSDFVHGPLYHWMSRRNRSVANEPTRKMVDWFHRYESLICDQLR